MFLPLTVTNNGYPMGLPVASGWGAPLHTMFIVEPKSGLIILQVCLGRSINACLSHQTHQNTRQRRPTVPLA